VSITPFVILCLLAFLFGFFDGFHGSGNVVATVIFSRSMPVARVLLLAALGVFLGPFLFGVAIAETIGSGLADPGYFTIPVTMAAVLSATLWKAITGRLGLPASSSHSLIGGLVGAVVAANGLGVLQRAGLVKVGLALTLSPILGLLAGYGMMHVILFLSRGATPRINEFFKRGQWLTAAALALSYGTNDAQKTMSIIALGLVASGIHDTFTIPLWVVAASAASMALGTLFGGRRIIKTLGGKFYKVRPLHGFVAQMTGAAVIISAALLGGPVSTTQTVSSAIIGVGTAERLSKVRWTVFYDMAMAWLLTIPFTLLMGALLYFLINSAFALSTLL
jgi:PiT family inorganic phosphate transporter